MTKTKLILVIELEMEKDVPDIAREVCQRITMHPHVHDANPLSIAPSLEAEHAPKAVNVNTRSYMGMATVSVAEQQKIADIIKTGIDSVRKFP